MITMAICHLVSIKRYDYFNLHVLPPAFWYKSGNPAAHHNHSIQLIIPIRLVQKKQGAKNKTNKANIDGATRLQDGTRCDVSFRH
jgi:hypothetical protein